jgi:hypothetical protein
VSHRVLSLGVELQLCPGCALLEGVTPTSANSKFQCGRKVIGTIGSRASDNPATLPTSRKMTILTSKLPLNSVEINTTDSLPSALSRPRRETSPKGNPGVRAMHRRYVRRAIWGIRARGLRVCVRLITVQMERHRTLPGLPIYTSPFHASFAAIFHRSSNEVLPGCNRLRDFPRFADAGLADGPQFSSPSPPLTFPFHYGSLYARLLNQFPLVKVVLMHCIPSGHGPQGYHRHHLTRRANGLVETHPRFHVN